MPANETAQLIHADCMEAMHLIADGSVDMVCADAPYGTTQCAKLTKAQRAELPEKFSMLHRTDFHEDYHSTMAFKSDEVFDAIRAAGFKCVGDE